MKFDKTAGPISPDSPELWRKFIDPADWAKAQKRHPKAPWKFYLKPEGQNDPEKWEYFQRAARWVWKRAAENQRRADECLMLRDILKINALVMHGNAALWQSVLRKERPIFNYRSAEEILRVYKEGTCFFKNRDGLSLRVEGFWPAEKMSLEFFAACRALSGLSFDENPKAWGKAFLKFKSMLYSRIPKRSGGKWQVYFLTRRKDLTRQMEALLNWYNKSASRLLRLRAKNSLRAREVFVLAVKMQRYIDIAQFCMDGSGRTSKLLQDYIILRFGHVPPRPVLFRAYGRAWENGTYLPEKEALRMAGQGVVENRRERSSRA